MDLGDKPSSSSREETVLGMVSNTNADQSVLDTISQELDALNDDQLAEVLSRLPPEQLTRAFQHVLSSLSAPYEGDKRDDARRSQRQRTLRSGRIAFNNGNSTANCQIRDVSDQGCRVALETSLGIPDRFALHFLNGNVKRECEVKWRKAGEMGLAFTD